jgi:hypothetical protein
VNSPGLPLEIAICGTSTPPLEVIPSIFFRTYMTRTRSMCE